MLMIIKVTQGDGDDDMVSLKRSSIASENSDRSILVSPADLVHHCVGQNRDFLLVQESLPDVDQGLVAVQEASVRKHLFVVAPGLERHVVDVGAS